MITIDMISAAARLIESFLYPTPVVRLPWLDQQSGGVVSAKLENLQRTGSFKIRGACHAIMRLEQARLERGVVTASAGNHGLGVALASRLRGCKATVFVARNASSAKVAKLRELGATIEFEGEDYDTAEDAARRFAAREELPFVHPFDDDAVIAGQGTVGLELMRTVPNLSTVVVPVGGGGLLAGVSIAVKASGEKVRVIGVQSEASPAMEQALKAGKVVDTPVGETVADGLAGRFVTTKTLSLAQEFCDRFVLVSESAIKHAMRLAYEKQGWRIEGSAAVGLAAILSGKIDAAGGACVTIFTGGNIAAEDFHRQIAPVG